jgi:hypothetical protein
VHSPAIDVGAFLTTTVASGSGISMPVADARYFSDGFGIPGAVPDTVQLQGEATAVTVQAVDYATNTLTLSAPLTWGASQGVAHAFTGLAPDLGAWEYYDGGIFERDGGLPLPNDEPDSGSTRDSGTARPALDASAPAGDGGVSAPHRGVGCGCNETPGVALLACLGVWAMGRARVRRRRA